MKIDWPAVWAYLDRFRDESFKKNLKRPGERRERMALPGIVAKHTKPDTLADVRARFVSEVVPSATTAAALQALVTQAQELNMGYDFPGVPIDAVHKDRG